MSVDRQHTPRPADLAERCMSRRVTIRSPRESRRSTATTRDACRRARGAIVFASALDASRHLTKRRRGRAVHVGRALHAVAAGIADGCGRARTLRRGQALDARRRHRVAVRGERRAACVGRTPCAAGEVARVADRRGGSAVGVRHARDAFPVAREAEGRTPGTFTVRLALDAPLERRVAEPRVRGTVARRGAPHAGTRLRAHRRALGTWRAARARRVALVIR